MRDPAEKYDVVTIENLLKPCSVLYNSGENRSLSWRLMQLRAMRQMILNHKQEFLEALKLDLGKSYHEGEWAEISITLSELDETISNLSSWMKPVKVKSPGTFWVYASFVIKVSKEKENYSNVVFFSSSPHGKSVLSPSNK